MQLKDHGGYQTSWGHGTYLYGLQAYVVNTLGYDTSYSWGSGYALIKVFLGSGDDKVYGNIGSEKVHTGAGDDLIHGGAGDDQLIGGDGDDVIYGDWGNDILYGGAGNDTIYGGTGDFEIHYYGTKVLPRSGIGENYYGDGDDMLFGGDGNDTLIDKGEGNNIFVGSRDFDFIHMGSGQNTVVVDPSFSQQYYSYDHVYGFSDDDLIYLPGLAKSETALEEAGIYWLEEYGGTIVYIKRDYSPDEAIVILELYTGLTLANFGIDLPVIEPEPQPEPEPAPEPEPEPKPVTIEFTTKTFTQPAPEKVVPQEPEVFVSEVKKTSEDKPVEPKDVTVENSGSEDLPPKPPEQVITPSVVTKVTLPPQTKDFTSEAEVFAFTPKPTTPPAQTVTTKITVASMNAIFGTDASDTISGTVGADLVRALKGNDLVRGGTGDDLIHGNDGHDNLYGDDGDDTLYGGAGNDNLRGGAGNDVLIGGDGDADIGFFLYSNLVSDAQSPVLTVDLNLKANAGRKFKKTPEGSSEEMVFHRFWVDLNNNGKRDDADEFDFYTGIENFFIRGGTGNDKITGAKGDDTLHGHKGNDKLKGKAGNDRLFGNEGDDMLYGGGGDDILVGGSGLDIMAGGKGDDTFYIGDLASNLKSADVILDYGNGADALSFVTGTSKVYARKSGKDTILQDGDGPNAEFYAILKGYTDPITDLEADGVTFIEIV